MTVSDTNNNLASLVSRIEQLEVQQDIWKKNTVWLKRCFDESKQDFDRLAELSQVESNREQILQLSAQLNELQQRLDKVPYVADNPNSVPENSAVEKENLRQELLVKKHSQFKQKKLNVSSYAQDIGEKFWNRYENGDRSFVGINLTGADLTKKSPNGVNLSRANLIQVNLSGTDWSNEKLRGANLVQADLNNTNLSGANLQEAILDDAFLFQAQLESADFYKASLKGANLTEADLSNANFTSADLRAADLTNANLENACLANANLAGAILDNANLTGAMMPDGTIHE